MKKAIIVGATSGIGRALALELVRHDYRVGITGRRAELLETLKQQRPDRFLTCCADVNTLNNIPALDELVSTLGGLDLLVISAGTGKINPSLDFLMEKTAIDTNVAGFTQIADWGYLYFRDQKKQGHIVAITSVAGMCGNRFAPAYNASKAYQYIYLDSLRHKATFDRLPLTITDIRPGFVDTAMGQAAQRFWVSSPERAARQIYRAIATRRNRAYITRRWVIIAMLMRTLPGWLLRKL